MKRPWMPLYVADYRSSTIRLTTLQHGAYFLLIMHYWDEGKLPTNDADLALIAGVTAKEWGAMRQTIAKYFTSDWRHIRIDKELAKCAELSEKSRKSAQKRWDDAKRDPKIIKFEGGAK